MCAEAIKPDRTEDVADFAEGLQDLVNKALNFLTAVEIVGVLEVLKSEVLIEGNKQRTLVENLIKTAECTDGD
jgi:hypothetical protein